MVRLWVFRAWPILDRRGLPGRSRDVRGAPALRRDAASCRPRTLLRRGCGTGRSVLDHKLSPRIPARARNSAAEWLRGHVLSGLPWNILGYALTYPLPLMQSAAVLGIYGLTLATMLIFGLPLVLWNEAPQAMGADASRSSPRYRNRATRVSWRHSAPFGWHLRPTRRSRVSRCTSCNRASRSAEVAPGKSEPHIPRPPGLVRHQSCRRHGPSSGVTYVIWPEAAMPFLPLDYPDVRAAIGRLLPSGTFLVAGALRAEPSPREHLGHDASSTAFLCLEKTGRLPPATTKSILCLSESICRCSHCWK